tara:strand:- start:232 stop:570 length:339 start_codon:yes stop_codon:yes gene_type:complete
MANTFKLKTKTNVGVTTVGIYTAPASTTTVVIGITMANTTGAGIHVGVGITRPAADVSKEDITLIQDVPIPQGSSFEFMAGNKLVLETEDTVTVESDTANSLDVALTIMEQT